jgi:hypothetical protein
MNTTKHAALSADRIQMVRNVARTAANRELRGDATGHTPGWWVAEYSYDLGIVDQAGMIDLTGEAAKLFTAERKRLLRRG